MTQNTTFLRLIQTLLTDEDIQEIADEFGIVDSSTKVSLRVLTEYMIVAAVEQWTGYRHAADVGPSFGLTKLDYSCLSKKLKELDYRFMKAVFNRLVSRLNRAARRKLKLKNQLLLIDSTTITVGQSRLPWAVYHGARAGVKLHVSYATETGMPVKVVETTGLKHDGPIGEQLADKRFVLVEDRAYFAIKRLDDFRENGQDFVVRMKDNVELFQPRSLQRQHVEGSNVTRDITCQLGTAQCRSVNRHRVVFFTDQDGREMRVVTSLMTVSAEDIAAMYKARWGIESFFRWIKQNLNVPTLFGTTENAVYTQLYAALCAYVLLKWLHDQAANKTPEHAPHLPFVGFQRLLLCDGLPVQWQSAVAKVLHHQREMNRFYLPDSG